MILIDANLLLHAKDASSPNHSKARTWLEHTLSEPHRVGMSWPALLAFVRIITNPRVYARPLSTADAWNQVEEWLALDTVWIPTPTERHADVLGQLLRASRATANLVTDAHLAALAIEHGLVVCSTDTDFARFPELSWRNPLA